MKFTLSDALKFFGVFAAIVGAAAGTGAAYLAQGLRADTLELVIAFVIPFSVGLGALLIFFWMAAMLEAQRYAAESQDAVINVLEEIDEVLIEGQGRTEKEGETGK